MVVISKNKINGVALGTHKDEIKTLGIGNLFYEYDESEKLVTVSVRSVELFSIDGTIINFDNLQDFLIKQNPIVDGDFFIFSEYSLSLYINFENRIFLEILLYSDSLKVTYENPLLKRYNELKSFVVTKESNIIFLPYKSIGKYEFGMDENEFVKKHNIISKPEIGVGGKKIYEDPNYIFRFDNNCFSQLNVFKTVSNIMVNNLNLEEYISQNLSKEKNLIISRTHTIFPEIGLAISKELNDQEFFFFSEYLLKFWENTKRPITSW